MSFKRTAAITLPTLSHKKVDRYFLRFETDIYVGKIIPKKDKDGKDVTEKPADCARVINLETGEVGEYLLPTIVRDEFLKLPAYKGHCFEITKLGRREGKRYDDFSIYEIEDPSPTVAAHHKVKAG